LGGCLNRMCAAWVMLVVLSALSAAQEEAPSTAPVPPRTGTAASLPQRKPAPGTVSVEQLADRLRVMEETNRKLAEQLESNARGYDEQVRINKKLAEQLETNARMHDEQMRLVLDRFGELSRRLNEGTRGGGGGEDGATRAEALRLVNGQ